jgi:hypothetical protein
MAVLTVLVFLIVIIILPQPLTITLINPILVFKFHLSLPGIMVIDCAFGDDNGALVQAVIAVGCLGRCRRGADEAKAE